MPTPARAWRFNLRAFAFSSPEPTILLACGRNRELWEQPFWNNKGNNRILPIRSHAVCIYGACLKWRLLELSIPAAGQQDCRLWGREWDIRAHCYCTSLLRMQIHMPRHASSAPCPTGHEILPSRGCKAHETMVANLRLNGNFFFKEPQQLTKFP